MIMFKREMKPFANHIFLSMLVVSSHQNPVWNDKNRRWTGSPTRGHTHRIHRGHSRHQPNARLVKMQVDFGFETLKFMEDVTDFGGGFKDFLFLSLCRGDSNLILILFNWVKTTTN